MRIPFVVLVGTGLILCLPTAARADIPPPPPPGLRDSAGPRPLPIALAGVAAALAVGLGGILVARHRRIPGVRTAAFVVAAAILATAAVVAFQANRDWDEQAALKARHEKDLANWRPRGPVRPPRAFRETPLAVAVFAVAPQDSFPHNLPWAALVLYGTAAPNSSPFASGR